MAGPGGSKRVHGCPSGRPLKGSGQSWSPSRPGRSGVSGSRKARLRWTGPAGPPALPAACPHAWQASDRQYAAAPGRRSGTPASQNQRTAPPYSLTWSIAWLEPVLLSSGGRSAVSTSSGMPDSSASMTAGWKLAAAVPEVHSTATGRRLALARPSAANEADRSSILTCRRSLPRCSRALNAMASGVLRDPGARTTSRSPHRASSSPNARPNAVDGFTGADPSTPRPGGPTRTPRRGTPPRPRPGPATGPGRPRSAPGRPGPRRDGGPAAHRPRGPAGRP